MKFDSRNYSFPSSLHLGPLFLDLGDIRCPAFLTFERRADRECFLGRLELSVRGSQRDLARALWPSGGEGVGRARTRPYWCTSCNKHCEKKNHQPRAKDFTQKMKKKMSSSFSTVGRRAEKVGPEFIRAPQLVCFFSPFSTNEQRVFLPSFKPQVEREEGVLLRQ